MFEILDQTFIFVLLVVLKKIIL